MFNHPTIPPTHHPSDPKIIFFGNTKYSKIVASALFKKFDLTAVLTIFDKPSGRNRVLTPNQVKVFAKENKIELVETEKLDDLTIKIVANLKPDFLVVSDFGLILPENLLQVPKYTPLNVHHSILPKYRGPSPAPSAILAGEEISGVTIIKMTKDVDSGPILAQQEYRLKPDETTDSLLTELNKLGAQLVSIVIKSHLAHSRSEDKTPSRTHSGSVAQDVKIFRPPQDQDESKATYTRRFIKKDGFIDLKNPPDPQKLDRMIRAFYPWPGVYANSKIKNQKSKIIKFLPNLPTILPTYHPADPFLIQPEGKRPLTIGQFRNGYPQFKETIEKLIKK